MSQDHSIPAAPGASITGVVAGGVGDAQVWLNRFNPAYARKLGMPVFPGSLNIRLAQPLNWTGPAFADALIRFDRSEYGGERDILFLPCRITSLLNHRAYLWCTTTPRDPADWRVLEVVTDVSLRATYGLRDGDPITLQLGAGG